MENGDANSFYVQEEEQFQEINLAYPGNAALCSMIHTHVSSQIDRHSGKDVNLHSGGRVTRLHSGQLSLWSPLFRGLVTETDPFQSRQSIDLILPEFSHLELELFSQFIYSGELRMKQRQLSRIKALLKLFRISLVLEVYKTELKSENTEETPQHAPHAPQADGRDILLWEMPNNQQSKTQTLQCYKCNKVFTTLKGLNSHTQTQHFGTSKHQCDICSKVFASKETLNNHKKCHTGAFNQCSECEKKFVCERDLDDHMNVHTGKKAFLCSICGDTFKTRKQILNHKEKHKRSKNPCSICGAVLKSKASYTAHIKSHNQEKSHECKLCARSFKRNYDLKVHMRTHTGAKPYNCNQCDKSFSLSSTLSKHRKLVHSNRTDVVYPCGSCGRNFSTREEVEDHAQNPCTQTVQDVVVVSSSEELIAASAEQPNQINQPISRIVEIGIQNISQPLFVKFD